MIARVSLFIRISSARRSKFICVFDIYVPTYVGLDVFHAPMLSLVSTAVGKYAKRCEKCVPLHTNVRACKLDVH